MFPYLHILYFQLGPIKIYTWGLFVSLGFLVAFFLLIKKYPAEKNILIDLLLYILAGSMLGARLFFILFYSGDIAGGLRDFFKIWNGGMSSFGGFFGGALAVFIYARLKKIKFYPLAEKLAFVLPLGLAIARIGCYLINDHPGISTGSGFFAVNYPDGARYDMGLLLMFFDATIFIYFLLKKGLYLEKFLLIYGGGRFLLDFLRIGEPSLAGLLPSQYGSILLFATGIILTIKNMKFNMEFLKSEKLTKILFYIFTGLLVLNQLFAAFILLFKKIKGLI